MDEPPVKAYIKGTERWQTLNEWPPAGGTTELALSADGALATPDEAAPFKETFSHDPQDPIPGAADIQDIRDYEARCLTYTSQPLTESLTVVGSPVLRLFLRSTAEDAHVMVKLCDVFPGGRSRRISSGRLRAAHRAGHERAVPLTPGETAELTIPLWPLANTFAPGHRIRIAVAGSEVPRCEVCPLASDNTIVGTEARRPTLSLPTIAAQ
jgi:putative CocE/NonD family hydrolase